MEEMVTEAVPQQSAESDDLAWNSQLPAEKGGGIEPGPVLARVREETTWNVG
jgi:hypothetical protein